MVEQIVIGLPVWRDESLPSGNREEYQLAVFCAGHSLAKDVRRTQQLIFTRAILLDESLSLLHLTAPYTNHTKNTRLFGFPPSSLIFLLTIKLIFFFAKKGGIKACFCDKIPSHLSSVGKHFHKFFFFGLDYLYYIHK